MQTYGAKEEEELNHPDPVAPGNWVDIGDECDEEGFRIKRDGGGRRVL